MKACSVCGAAATKGTRCAIHYVPPHSSSRTYQQNAKAIVVASTLCHICLKPATEDDPMTADHLVPHSRGGSFAMYNLKPAHRSCNSRAGAGITNAA